MKLILVSLIAITSLTASAQPLTKVVCTIDGKKVSVPVTRAGQPEKEVSIRFQNHFADVQKAIISVSYNGTSTDLKPGAAGNYTLTVIIKKAEGRRTSNAGYLNFSASFPTSGTVSYSSENDDASDPDAMFSGFNCQ